MTNDPDRESTTFRERLRMSRDKAQALATNPAFARAIKAVHSEFENALIAEWDIRGDSAKIRNAMQPLPNRCQQCKKPAAGTGDICGCKTKTGYERCLSNPRNTLLEVLRRRCQSILVSVSLKKFVEQITSIGVANGRDLDWVEGQIHGLRSSFSRVCRKWIVGICPPPFNDTGVLPAWLKDDRVILDAELHRGLSSDESEAELVLIEAQIAQHFQEAGSAALDQASIQMAQVVRLAPEHVPRKRARQNIIAAVIARIKRDNPDLSIERICQLLDVNKCPLRESDKRAGFSSWHAAWNHPQYRNRIKRFISDIEPAAAEKKV
jgi:hypothetical protein